MSAGGGAAAAIAIGSSTGGPQALIEVLGFLRGLPVPLFITQHMPEASGGILAPHITRQTGVPCSEAIEGEIVRPGHAYFAPGDRHLTMRQFGADVRVTLQGEAATMTFRYPAIDRMLKSLVPIYGSRLVAAILTGMGDDGAAGAALVQAAGGAVIAQDEATSVVWGMPGAVVKRGLASAILPLGAIGPRLRHSVVGNGKDGGEL